MLAQLALALGVVFAVNLLPAFGPPTWAVLVFFSLDFDLPAVPLVIGGAVAAASGRFVLATASRRLRSRLPKARQAHLDRAQAAALSANRLRAAGGLGLFAISPLPSGQLFVAAGLMTVPLLPLTAAFFAGRLVSYSLYVGAETIAERNHRIAAPRCPDLAARHRGSGRDADRPRHPGGGNQAGRALVDEPPASSRARSV